jgi:hypothetical protein
MEKVCIDLPITDIFAGTASGVIQSIDKGETWNFVNEGFMWMDLFPHSTLSMLSIPDQEEVLLAGTMGAAVWKRALSDLVTSARLISDTIPTMFTIRQNYPNPFNLTTTIHYEIPFESFVSLKIYDLLGREVVVLIHERLGAGSYTVTWHAEGIAGGTYLYRFDADGFSKAKKLLLLK